MSSPVFGTGTGEHIGCELEKNCQVLNQLLRRVNPEYEAVDYLYTQVIERLRVERVRRLARVGESQLGLFGEEERELLESLGKAEDGRDLRQVFLDLPAELLSKVTETGIDSGKGEKLLSKPALDKYISENINQLVISINSYSYVAPPPNQLSQLLSKQYLRESINSSLIIQSAEYQGRTIDKLPPGVDFSKITSLSVSYYDDKLTPFFLKHLINLKKLQITHLDKASGMYLGYAVPTSFNPSSPDSQNFQTIKALAKLPSLKQLTISQFKDLRDQQYIKYLLLFPSNKSLKLHDRFANKFTIMEILMQRQDWDSLHLSFGSTLVGSQGPPFDQHLTNFLFLTTPHLKELTILYAKLHHSTLLSLSKFASLTKLELFQNTGQFQQNTIVTYMAQGVTENLKPALKTLLGCLGGLQILDLTSAEVSHTHIETIKLCCLGVRTLSFRTGCGEGVPLFVQLVGLKNLEELNMNVEEISDQGWYSLAKAEFRLKKFYLTQRHVPVDSNNPTQGRFYTPPINPNYQEAYYDPFGPGIVGGGGLIPQYYQQTDYIPKSAFKFFLTQPTLTEFKTKSPGNNTACMIISYLPLLETIAFSTHLNHAIEKPLTDSGRLYLSKLRNVKTLENYANLGVSYGFYSENTMRLVKNNRGFKVAVEGSVMYNDACKKMVRNMGVMERIVRPAYLGNYGAVGMPVRNYGMVY